MFAALLLVPLLSSAPAADDLPRSPIAAKELEKCAKDVAVFFKALEDEETELKAKSTQQEALDAIHKAITALAKKHKLDAPLAYAGDWEQILEASKPEDRSLKAQCGKGFFRHQYVDKVNDNTTVACLLSLPAGYAKGELLPVVVALKPGLGLKGEALETRTREMADAMYPDLIGSHIVLVPLGRETGEGRKAEASEVEGSWFTDDGLVTLFTNFRLLLEQVRMDRSRVTLDGWGAAGVDALRVATSFPSWFAGVVNRSGEVGGDEMLFENLTGVPVLYVAGEGDGVALDLEALAARTDAPAGITVVRETGSALAPGEEARKAIAAWLSERQRSLAPAAVHFKIADERFQSVDWLKATRISRRANAKPDDKDFPRIEASIDRAANRITLDTVNVLELNLFLSDALVDLDKPVVVTVNGKERVNESFSRDMRKMLEYRYFNTDGYCGLYTADELIEGIDPNVPAAKDAANGDGEAEKKKP